MPRSTAHRRSHRGRLAALAALAVCLVFHPTAPGTDDPPRTDPKPAGRIFVQAYYFGTEPGAKPEGIVALDPDTGQPQVTYPLRTPGEPSPDGRRFVYPRWGNTVPENETGIWVYDANGAGSSRRIFDRKGEPTWTDQEKSVVIAVNPKDDLWETWRVNADGTGRVKLPIPDGLLVLDASPDGVWLAARDLGDAKHWARLTVIHPDGTGTRYLTEGSPERDVFPIFRFSPDSREIAYVEVKTVDGIRTSRLFLIDIDGKNRRELPVTLRRGATAMPVWSPDGSRLALSQASPQVFDIVVVGRDGKGLRKLPLPPQSWSFRLCGWSR